MIVVESAQTGEAIVRPRSAKKKKKATRFMDENEGLDARLQTLLGKRGEELAKSLIEEFARLNRELAGLKRELGALADYQAAHDRLLILEDAVAGIVRLPRIAIIEPDQSLRPHDGFYGVEHTAGSVPFRWTGPSARFSFDLFVDRVNGADVRLDALNCIDYEAQRNLLLVADGEPVPVTVTPHDMGFIASARLLPRSGAQGTNLVFILPAVFVPPESTDQRELGIAFGRLVVTSRIAGSDVKEQKALDALAAGPAGQNPADDNASDIDDTDELTRAVIS